jgi:hypothetical protein
MGAGWQTSRPQGWKIRTTVTPGVTVPIDGNGFQDNADIEHIYLEGFTDNSCQISTFDQGAFGRMLGLRYIDIPLSLKTIGAYCFQFDVSLSIRDLTNVTDIGQNAFRYCNVGVEDPYAGEGNFIYYSWHESDLFLAGGAVSIGQFAFQGCGWETIHLGSAADPLQVAYAKRTIHSGQAMTYIYDPIMDSYDPVTLGMTGLNTIIVTSAVETQSNYSGTTISQTAGVDVVVQNP